jgi:hypothetical protein
MALFTTAFINEPSSFEEAINCEKKDDQDTWKEVIDKELNELTKREEFGKSCIKDVPND